MTGKEMLKLYKKNGWKVLRIEGSHFQMGKGEKRETIPIHAGEELGTGLQAKLLKRLKEID